MQPFSQAEIKEIDAQASRLMKRGIALMAEAKQNAVVEALACFDRARELRSSLPVEEIPTLKYGLAACWLNRADALMQLNPGRDIAAALQSYDEGITLLRGLSLAADPRFARRMAIALQNRGLALQTLPGLRIQDVTSAFEEAIGVLQHSAGTAIADRRILLATVWVNLANVLVNDPESRTKARDAALRAIALSADSEDREVDAAEVGLKARHVLCQTLAAKLSAEATIDGTMPDDVHEATDLAEAGLALIRRWERRGVLRFEMLKRDLFRFGAAVYEKYQPHFLQEYLEEHAGTNGSNAP